MNKKDEMKSMLELYLERYYNNEINVSGIIEAFDVKPELEESMARDLINCKRCFGSLPSRVSDTLDEVIDYLR